MFGEQSKEINQKTGVEVSVWKSPKYMQSRMIAEECIKKGEYNLTEEDFWIQKNMNKKGDRMIYSGLIISHNACLKINDKMPSGKKFDPESVFVDKDGYGSSLVVGYKNSEQGIYEFGEVNRNNCTMSNSYPYAMALKRCFDRVVLKLSKLAYGGIYADTESEEFAESDDDRATQEERYKEALKRVVLEPPVCPVCGKDVKDVKTKDGAVMTADEIYKTYGMCADCVRESKK